MGIKRYYDGSPSIDDPGFPLRTGIPLPNRCTMALVRKDHEFGYTLQGTALGGAVLILLRARELVTRIRT